MACSDQKDVFVQKQVVEKVNAIQLHTQKCISCYKPVKISCNKFLHKLSTSCVPTA